MGVTVSPNGKAVCWLSGDGTPTRSMMTEVVSQKAAAKQVSEEY